MNRTLTGQLPVTGSMGSKFWQIVAPPELLPMLASLDWNRLGKRVMIHPETGIIAWMSPSSEHEDLADAADRVVEMSRQLLDMSVKGKRGTRWKRPQDPEKTGLEADAAFYVGWNAERWYAARERGAARIEAFESAVPPDIVVEVEVTHLDERKAELWAALGVREMWRVSRKERDGPIGIQILDLRATERPQPATGSVMLPGLSNACLSEALGFAEAGRYEDLRNILGAALAPKLLEGGGNALDVRGND